MGWALDTFGHNAQMPQILKLAGYKSYWFQRGVPDNEVPSEWLWEGIDGTRIPAFYLPRGYGLMGNTPAKIDEFIPSLKKRFDSLIHGPMVTTGLVLTVLMLLNLLESVPVMVSEFEKKADKPFNLGACCADRF